MRSCRRIYDVFKAARRDFPGGPGVKTASTEGGAGSIPDQGSKISHALPHGQKTNKQTNKKSKQRLRKVNCAILIIIANIY